MNDIAEFMKSSLELSRESILPYKIPEVKFESGNILLVPTADWHLSSPDVNEDAFLADLDFICSTDGIYMIALGDYADFNTKLSPGDGLANQKEPNWQQYFTLKNLFRKLGNVDKLIAVLSGNHELRLYKNDFILAGKEFADEAGVPYLHCGGRLDILVGSSKYRMFITHKAGSARINKQHSLRTINNYEYDADILVEAHKHSPYVYKEYARGEWRGYVGCGTYKQHGHFENSNNWAGQPNVMPGILLRVDSKEFTIAPNFRELVPLLKQRTDKNAASKV